MALGCASESLNSTSLLVEGLRAGGSPVKLSPLPRSARNPCLGGMPRRYGNLKCLHVEGVGAIRGDATKDVLPSIHKEEKSRVRHPNLMELVALSGRTPRCLVQEQYSTEDLPLKTWRSSSKASSATTRSCTPERPGYSDFMASLTSFSDALDGELRRVRNSEAHHATQGDDGSSWLSDSGSPVSEDFLQMEVAAGNQRPQSEPSAMSTPYDAHLEDGRHMDGAPAADGGCASSSTGTHGKVALPGARLRGSFAMMVAKSALSAGTEPVSSLSLSEDTEQEIPDTIGLDATLNGTHTPGSAGSMEPSILMPVTPAARSSNVKDALRRTRMRMLGLVMQKRSTDDGELPSRSERKSSLLDLVGSAGGDGVANDHDAGTGGECISHGGATLADLATDLNGEGSFCMDGGNSAVSSPEKMPRGGRGRRGQSTGSTGPRKPTDPYKTSGRRGRRPPASASASADSSRDVELAACIESKPKKRAVTEEELDDVLANMFEGFATKRSFNGDALLSQYDFIQAMKRLIVECPEARVGSTQKQLSVYSEVAELQQDLCAQLGLERCEAKRGLTLKYFKVTLQRLMPSGWHSNLALGAFKEYAKACEP